MLLALMRQINVAIIGGGTVGGGVYKAPRAKRSFAGFSLGGSVVGYACRRARSAQSRAVSIPEGEANHGLEVSGEDEAQSHYRSWWEEWPWRVNGSKSHRAGKLVVTANKALLSEHGEELFELARKHHTNLYYEASVAGESYY